MTDPKYIRYEDAAAKGWFSRTEWRRRKILIADDAKPRDHVWRPASREAYPVFSEEQGTPILPKRQPKASADERQADWIIEADAEVLGSLQVGVATEVQMASSMAPGHSLRRLMLGASVLRTAIRGGATLFSGSLDDRHRHRPPRARPPTTSPRSAPASARRLACCARVRACSMGRRCPGA